VLITFAPRDNQERQAVRRVLQWHVVRRELGRILIAECVDYLRRGDLRWIDQAQVL
jgi:hypothetical protein